VQRVLYYKIRTPSKQDGRASVSIQQKQGQSEPWRTLRLNSIDAINDLLQKGVIDNHTAVEKAKAVLAQLYKERDKALPKSVFNSQNLKLLDVFWEAEYSDRDIIATASVFGSYRQAIESIGSLSIAAASRKQLQDAIDTKFVLFPNKQRRAVQWLNTLLRYAGRDFQLKKKREVKHAVKYLSLAEFRQMSAHLNDPIYKLMAEVAFGTGLRLGEIFALRANPFKRDSIIHVDSQIDKDGIRRETKTRKGRQVYVLKEFRESVSGWAEIPEETKLAYRGRKYANVIRAACERAFPGDASKVMRFHDLRHCYCVHALGSGAPSALIAQSIGDSIAVFEKHYAGHILSESAIDLLDKFLG